MKKILSQTKLTRLLILVLALSLTVLAAAACTGTADRNKKETKEMKVTPATDIRDERENTTAGSDGKIVTTGQGAVMLKPDRARISLGITTTNEKAADASAENAKKMNDLIEVIKGLGIDEKDIHTMNYSIYARYDYSQDTRRFVGYEVSNTLEIIVNDMDKTSEILDKAVGAGANEVNSVSFEVTNKKEAYNKALEAAVTDAKEKAELLAQSSGLKGELTIVSISENAGYEYPMLRGEGELMKDAAAPTPLLPNLEKVQATVVVEFAFK